MLDTLQLLVSDYTVRTIVLGTTMIGVVSGALGCFTLLRKQSLLGDAISHAALPGIVIAFMLTGTKNPLLLFVGALGSGALGVYFTNSIIRHTRLKSDAAMGVVLSVFFGFGILLLTYVQKMPNANQAGLDSYLFGQAATLLSRDVLLMTLLGGICLVAVALLWKELKLLTFDREYAVTLGFNPYRINAVLSTLIVIAIIIGLQTVGVVLMSAMLIAPAAAARQWTHRLGIMVCLSGTFGAVSGILGSIVSALNTRLATGPVIVLIASTLVVISFVFAPGRGLLARQIRQFNNRKTLRMNKTLAFMYSVARTHSDIRHPHAIAILNNFQGFTQSALETLVKRGFATIDQDSWSLTEEGYEQGKYWYSGEELVSEVAILGRES